jgi:hypothetical protein
MNIIEGLSWRYQVQVRPRLLLHENPCSALLRSCRNLARMREDQPTCYISADATNIGDRVSALGVRSLVKKPGIELFASRAALASTVGALSWLQANRPGTRIYIGGGGLLQECFVPFWESLLEISLPFVLFGVGANELAGQRSLPSADLLNRIARHAKAVHVRDFWTKSLLDFGQSREVTVGVCPAVNYLASRYGDPPVQEQKYLLHVQHPVDIRLAGGDAERINTMVRSTANSLGLIYDETDHIKENLDELCARYRRARYVVSSRLHGCIFSYALNVPFLPVVTDRKTDAFLAAHCPDNPCLSVHAYQPEVVEKLLDLETRQGRCGGDLVNKVVSNAEVMAEITLLE